jgi:hypothetical protein
LPVDRMKVRGRVVLPVHVHRDPIELRNPWHELPKQSGERNARAGLVLRSSSPFWLHITAWPISGGAKSRPSASAC